MATPENERRRTITLDPDQITEIAKEAAVHASAEATKAAVEQIKKELPELIENMAYVFVGRGVWGWVKWIVIAVAFYYKEKLMAIFK